MKIGVLLAVIAALVFQQVIANDNNKSLREVFANWIQSQDAYFHWQNKRKENVDDISLQMNVVKWVRENGGYWNPKQEFRRVVPGDNSTPFGIFATDRIEKDELIASVPWKCVMTAGTDEWETHMHCNTTQFIIDEMRKGKASFYSPYTAYLLSAPPVNIPSMWSQQGKKKFKEIIGKKKLPPNRATVWMTKYWKEECNGSDDPFEIQAAMQLVSRGDDDTLTPVYDMYNHRNGKWLNTMPRMKEGVKHDMHASKTIEKGDQIYLSYNQCTDCWNRHFNFGTPEMFRDYGFVEQYPQRWIFHNEKIAFDVDENEETGQLKVIWLDEDVHKMFGKLYKVTEKGIARLEKHLKRLKETYETDLQLHIDGSSYEKALPQHELDSLMSYYHALTTALELAVDASKDYLDDDDDDEDDDD